MRSGGQAPEASRLFFALSVPWGPRHALGELRQGWDQLLYGSTGAPLPRERERWRWVSPGLLHVTLAFMGSRPAEEVAAILRAGKAAAALCAPFELRCQGLGAFPSSKNPSRILWAGFEANPFLESLAQALRERLLAEGLPVESKPFKAHITLARRRTGHQRGVPPVPAGLRTREWGTWRVDKLELLESHLRQGPPSYQRRASWRL